MGFTRAGGFEARPAPPDAIDVTGTFFMPEERARAAAAALNEALRGGR